MNRVVLHCDNCDKIICKCLSQIHKHNFCSKSCANIFSRKTNPKYKEYKNYANISAHMSKLNEELNPSRMTEETKSKIGKTRHERLFTGHSYQKVHGQHLHRVLVEQALGRKLRSDEIVHHIDHNFQNNDLSNLQIVTRAEHIKIHLHNKGGDAK